MITEGMIAQLINSKDDIFQMARNVGHKRKLILSSPLVLTRFCTLSPLCKHCCWQANRTLMRNYAHAKVSRPEAISRAERIEQSGTDRVYLVSGDTGKALPDYFIECIEAIKQNTSLDITATFGSINKPDLLTLKEIGVDRVSCALETTNDQVFHHLKPGDNYENRLKTLQTAKEIGLNISTNFLVGIGETIDDLDSSIRLAQQLGVDFLTISSLDPTPFTESETWDRPKPYFVARVVAAARIALPEVDISADFGCNTYAGLAWGMKSGANAFVVALRNSQETPELLGDETNRIHGMWKDYPFTNAV
jgi:biotin synthase-like enzyme